MSNLFDWPEGIVYLIQYSDEPIYKIGRTKRLNKRLWEIGGLLPYPITPIHVIRTDAPKWLENYWHECFAAKRRLGSGVKRASEWFDLSDEDVSNFSSHEEKNPEEGELLRYLEAQEEVELRQVLERQARRETALLRLISHVDVLTQKYPSQAIDLAKSCDFQIRNFDVKIARMIAKDFSEERAIQIWERDALSAANAKVRS